MRDIVKRLLVGTPLEAILRYVLNRPLIHFDRSESYWDRRYQASQNSGSGSYGRLAIFKAEIINEFVRGNGIRSVVEFGCGDGNQLALARYDRYLGVDVSPSAIRLCSERFSGDSSKRFVALSDYRHETADLAISLDVLFHLVEDEVFDDYMTVLFKSAERFVIIYSSNRSDDSWDGGHVRHRKFTDWTAAKAGEFRLTSHLPNQFQYIDSDPNNTSYSDFFFFARNS